MDWSAKKPPWTSQYSVPNRVDAMDCLSEALINIVFMLTGFDPSPRALARLSNTGIAGNSEEAVLNAANSYGLIPYVDWPSPQVFDWAQYYTPIPKDVLLKAVAVEIKRIPPDLNKSPLWTILRFPNGVQHGVAQLNETEYFDSEQGSEIKPLNYAGAAVVLQSSLQVTIKGAFMDALVPKSANIGGEEGIFLAAPTQEVYQAACVAYGKDPAKPEINKP